MNIKTYLGLFFLLILFVGGIPTVGADDLKTYLLDVYLPTKAPSSKGKTLLVSIPKAAPGFDTPAMLYTCKNSTNSECKGNEYELRAYRNSQWVDTPARMFLPLLVLHIEATGEFGAVLSAATTPVVCELRLDTEIIRLQQVFDTEPSQVHLVLRAQLLDMVNRQVLATEVFNIIEDARPQNAEGSVWATNQAVIRLLEELKTFLVKKVKLLD